MTAITSSARSGATGARIRVDGRDVALGNRALMESRGVTLDGLQDRAIQIGQSGSTPVFLARDGRLLDIVFPPQVPLKVAETAPPTRGGSDSAWKEARLETGVQVMVPLFIDKGETIRVDTITRKYVGRGPAV